VESKLDLLQGLWILWSSRNWRPWAPSMAMESRDHIEQVSGDELLLNQGTIYASLVRPQQRGWISAEWGTSDNNRKAKFYIITANGRKQMAKDAAHWHRLASVMGRVLAMPVEGEP
jgi:PadR family transcriptional regulator PadR